MACNGVTLIVLRRVLARVVRLAGLNKGAYTIWVDGDECKTYLVHRVIDEVGLSVWRRERVVDVV